MDPKYDERDSIVDTFREKQLDGSCSNAIKLDLKTLLDFEKKIKKMYEPGKLYQTHMGTPWAALIYYYRKKQDFLRSAEIHMQLFEMRKDMDNIFAFKMLILAYVDYFNSRSKEALKIKEMIKNYQIGSLDVYSYGYDMDLNFVLMLV